MWSIGNFLTEPFMPDKTNLTKLDALVRAEQCGTYGKPIRDAQYDPKRFPEEKSPERLLLAVNTHGNYIRQLQIDKERIRRQVMNLKLRNGLVVAVVTAALTRAPEILRWLARFFN